MFRNDFILDTIPTVGLSDQKWIPDSDSIICKLVLQDLRSKYVERQTDFIVDEDGIGHDDTFVGPSENTII